MASEKTFDEFVLLPPEQLKQLPKQELERLDKLLGHELEKKRQAEEAGKQLQHLNKELQDYAKQRPDDRPDPYSKLACKVAPDGKTLLAGSVNIYPNGPLPMLPLSEHRISLRRKQSKGCRAIRLSLIG